MKYVQVSFTWPRDLRDRFEDDFERLDAISRRLWGLDFRLTRAHLALAGIQHGLEHSNEWLHLAPNDSRLRSPKTSWSAEADSIAAGVSR